MTMTKRVRECRAIVLTVVAVLLAAGCKRSSADDSGLPPSGNGVGGSGSTAKASRPTGFDSLRDSARKVVGTARGNGRRVLFIGTSLTAGLGLSPDSAYP